uniref:Uncharacterized protein n=1 Tax=Aegilops tauschii subsp. strangulata TaxID=200361 RepID=A0A453ABR5_AEGTS
MKTLRYGCRREITRLMVDCSWVQMETRIICHLTRHGSWMTLSRRKIFLDKP